MRYVCLGLAILCSTPVWAYPKLSADETTKLKAGDVVVRSLTPTADSGVSVRAFGIINASPDAVWPVVRDCQYFKDFMPRTKQSRLMSKTGQTAVCFFEIDMPFPFDNLSSSVRSVEKALPQGGHTRSWTLIEGSYRRNNGSWTVVPWAQTKSLLVYFIDIDPKVSIPDFVIRKAQAGKLPEVFEAVERRVHSR